MEFDQMDAYSRVMIEIEFRPAENEGLIIYNGQKKAENLRGDFISLAMINGYLEFR